jgi:hypothetical protein
MRHFLEVPGIRFEQLPKRESAAGSEAIRQMCRSHPSRNSSDDDGSEGGGYSCIHTEKVGAIGGGGRVIIASMGHFSHFHTFRRQLRIGVFAGLSGEKESLKAFHCIALHCI